MTKPFTHKEETWAGTRLVFVEYIGPEISAIINTVKASIGLKVIVRIRDHKEEIVIESYHFLDDSGYQRVRDFDRVFSLMVES